MRVFTFITLIAILSMGITGCKKAAVEEGKIPITTSSDQARKEFLQGRDLADKLLLTNSIQHFDKAIALDSSFASAYLNRANSSLTANEFFFYLGKALALKNNCSEGERLLILSTEAGTNANTTKQKEYLDKLVVLFPNDESVRFNLGNYYFGEQEYIKAIEQYNKAVKIAPNYSPAYNILGYAYRQTENYTESEKAFKKYIELIPNDPNPYDSYAELLLKMGRFNESIANYQKALAADPNFVSSHIGIAANYMYKGDIDSGSAQLKKLTAITRNDGEKRQALFTQMVLYIDAGKMDLALKELEKQYELGEKTNDVAAISADCGFKGAILLETGKYDDALSAFEKSAQLIASSELSQEIKDAAQLFLHFNRANVAMLKKDLKKAKTETNEFRKVAEAAGDANQIRYVHELLGKIAFAEKNYGMAIEELLKANQQDPCNLYRLALSYQAKGDNAKAKEFCRKAAKFNGLPSLNYALIRIKAEKLLTAL
jgi:tetratricopeptide (TPR) repeat protein